VALGFIQGSFNPYIPLGFLIILWSNDTGAYLAGKSFGKHKLFERISPNKTWEGFVGGLILALFVGFNLAQYFGGLERWQWAVMAVIIAVFGTLGDLVESMLKRTLGVKDSGNILPGHGGLMDRFDGLLLAAPLVFLFLLVCQ
jgi:phosphatidate cytidylyltransferase